MIRPLSLAALSIALAASAGLPLARAQSAPAKEKHLALPLRSGGPGTLDPATAGTRYDQRCIVPVTEPLLQHAYFERPYRLEPLLLAALPSSEDGITWSFELKPGVRFADDPCFPGGKGRELVTADVLYSWTRLADPAVGLKNYWVFQGLVLGWEAYRDSLEKGDEEAQLAGFVELDERRFRVVLTRPAKKFLWTLAQYQTAIVAREAVEAYGEGFARHPVGTGPFRLDEWRDGQSLTYSANEAYHGRYPSRATKEHEAQGLFVGEGRQLPLVDGFTYHVFVEENPMWLEFKSGRLDFVQVPAVNQPEAFHKRSRELKRPFREKGITAVRVPLFDFIFRAFNMEDELLGGYDEKSRKLRMAIAHAIDFEEFNATFYDSANVVYDGMIPPGLAGHPRGGRGPVRYGFDLERSHACLAEAGYPGGEGLPPIDFHAGRSGNLLEQSRLFVRQLARVGIRVNPVHVAFPQLLEAVRNKKAPMFTYAWTSDYPDAESNLALFYGPNGSPGKNAFNYTNERFDELYERSLTMEDSPERTALYEQMRDLVMHDVPFVGSMARVRHYLIQPWLRGLKPSETFFNWVKYLDLDESRRP